MAYGQFAGLISAKILAATLETARGKIGPSVVLPSVFSPFPWKENGCGRQTKLSANPNSLLWVQAEGTLLGN